MNPFFQTEHPTSVYNFEDVLAIRVKNAESVAHKIFATCYFHENDFPLYMHSHSYYEINVIVEGEGVHYIGENDVVAKSGDVFIIPPNVRHGYEDSHDLSIFTVVLSDAFLKKYNLLLKEIYGFTMLFNIEPSLRSKTKSNLFPSIPPSDFLHLLNEMHKLNHICLQDSEGVLHEGMKCLKILNLLADFANYMDKSAAKDDQNVFVDTPNILKVLTYIENNYHTNVTINDLCKISNMSRSSLLKQFSEVCKYSPTDYLLSIRIEKACEFLKSTNLSVARIAQDCG
ncbi:MAG: AraC family ligand binding domain-containing protein, partial [Clostridia bacterium]|nr:AraC family ligand binding domain-containing protein [Clostridia bacterium]